MKKFLLLPLLLSLSLVASVGDAQTKSKKKKAKPKPKPAVEETVTPDVEGADKAVDAFMSPADQSTPVDTTSAAPAPADIQTNQTTQTPPPASVEAPPAEKPAEPASSSDSPHYFGLHAALGFPHPLSGGLNYVHSSQIFSVELNMGSYGMKTSDVDVKMSNTELGLRWHPFMGSFYLGSYLGTRALTVEKSDTIQGQKIDMKAEIKSNYVAPHIGWMWGMSDGGFFSSMELGVVSPSGVKTEFETNADTAVKATDEYKKLDKDIKDQGKKLGETSLPMFTLIKIGWLF